MTQIPIVNGTNGQTWMELWETEEYNDSKRLQWNIVDQYLNQAVDISCEIGCGQAYDSFWFQQAYGTEVYLIEGVSEKNNKEQSRDAKFGQADNFVYYHSKAELNAEWDRLELQRTHLTPENCSKLKKSTTFDLIFSFKSCGAHYPMSTYTDFIRKHSNKNTRLIFDLRNGQDTFNSIGIDYEIVDVIAQSKKHRTVELKVL
jgi:hypothetical protein